MPSASHNAMFNTTTTVNAVPHAAFTSTANNLAVSFDASTSTDSDGTLTAYTWNFGDSSTGSGITTSHTYGSAGTYSVVLTVTDNGGATDTQTNSITVTAAQQSGTLGDSGINQTNTAGRTQTGTGVIAITGATGATFSSVGVGKIASLASGTFYTSAFAENGGGSTFDTGAAIGTAIGGIYGAGSASTVVAMPANTTPPSETGDTSFMISQGASNGYASNGQMPGAYIIDGVKFLGPVTSVDYGGFYTYGAGRNGAFTMSNTTIACGKGSGGSPPAETTMFNLQRAGGSYPVTLTNVTFDGQNQAAAALETNYFGMNTSSGTITVNNLYSKDCPQSGGFCMHGNANGVTVDIHDYVSRNNARSLGMEANGGNINVYDPLWDDPTTGHKDMNITWTYNNYEGHINFYFTAQSNWDAFISTRTNKKITVVCNSTTQCYSTSTSNEATGAYGYTYTTTGRGNKIADYFKVYIANSLVGTGESAYATGFNGQ